LNKKSACMYCDAASEKRDSLMNKVGEYEESILYLMKDQTHKGRCVLALKEHFRELYELPREMLTTYMLHAGNVSKAITKLWNADKVNYAIYGDAVSHLHMHIVPKIMNALEWGGAFEVTNKAPVFLEPEEYDEMITMLRDELGI